MQKEAAMVLALELLVGRWSGSTSPRRRWSRKYRRTFLPPRTSHVSMILSTNESGTLTSPGGRARCRWCWG